MELKKRLTQFLEYYESSSEGFDFNGDRVIANYLELFPETAMGLELEESGSLVVSPKSTVQSYAIRSWMDSFCDGKGGELICLSFQGKGLPKVLNTSMVLDSREEIVKDVKAPTIEIPPKKKTKKPKKKPKQVVEKKKEEPKIGAYPDVNKDRFSANGEFVASDESVLKIVVDSKKPMSGRDVSTVLGKSTTNTIGLTHIYNSMNRLTKKGLLFKDATTSPITWSAQPVLKKKKLLVPTDFQRETYLKELGFKNRDEAISEMGSWKFEKKLKEWVNQEKD